MRPGLDLPMTVHGPIVYLGVPTSDGRIIDRLTFEVDRMVPVYVPAVSPSATHTAGPIGVVFSVEAQPGGLIGTLAVERDAWSDLRRQGPVRAGIDVDADGRLVGVALLSTTATEPIWPGDTILEPVSTEKGAAMNETTGPIDWNRLPIGATAALAPPPWMSAADAVARAYAGDSSGWAAGASDGQGNGAAIVLVEDVHRHYLSAIGINLPADPAMALLIQWDDRGGVQLHTGTEVAIRDAFEAERSGLDPSSSA